VKATFAGAKSIISILSIPLCKFFINHVTLRCCHTHYSPSHCILYYETVIIHHGCLYKKFGRPCKRVQQIFKICQISHL
jgi:hypothetical protein